MRFVKTFLVIALLLCPLALRPAGAGTPDSKSSASDSTAGTTTGVDHTSGAIADADLPTNVVTMRDSLLAAARSGQIEEIRTPFEWNELPPALSDSAVDDPIDHLKSVSADGQGAEVLANLLELLSLSPAKLHLGRDIENSAIYVWPYLSELPLKELTPRQKVELFAIAPPEVAKAILESGHWSWWRLTIGADGTWHSFMKHEK